MLFTVRHSSKVLRNLYEKISFVCKSFLVHIHSRKKYISFKPY